MNNLFRVSCNEVRDEIYEFGEDGDIPPLRRLRMGLHLFFCASCARELRKLEILREVSRSSFFPPAPSFEEKVMERLSGEFLPGPGESQRDYILPGFAGVPAGVSFRSWVIVGLIVLLSLGFSFFGIEFTEAAANNDSSFLIPLGITVGTVLTCYGAFFIASHLKELSEHFNIPSEKPSSEEAAARR